MCTSNALRGIGRGAARRAISTAPQATQTASRLAVKPPQPLPAPSSASVQSAVLEALASPTPSISCVFLYDKRGSELFEEICETPEYYLTRVEDALLHRITPELVRFADEAGGAGDHALPAAAWIECSAGNGEKVAPLMLAAAEARPTTYVPLDVSSSALAINLGRFDGPGLATRHELNVWPIAGTNEQGLAAAARLCERKSFMLLGSSLGNALRPHEELGMIAKHMGAADRLLVGVDTPPAADSRAGKKSKAEVVAAYNDKAGVTAAFTLNALAHLNRVAATDFCLSQFAPRSEWCEERCAILAHLEALVDVRVSARLEGAPEGVPPVPVLQLRKGERIFVEQSAKFSLASMRAIAAKAGLRVARHWLAERDFYLIVECERADDTAQ